MAELQNHVLLLQCFKMPLNTLFSEGLLYNFLPYPMGTWRGLPSGGADMFSF